jgi:hypothetical protein
LGFSSGDKQKSSTTPQVAPELRQLYGQITDVAGSNVPAFKNLISRALAGDKTLGSDYVSAPGASYASTFQPLESTYQPLAGTYRSAAETFTPLAGTFTPTASTFAPTAAASTAPMMLKAQQAQQQIARTMPRGGAADAARAHAGMEANVQAGQVQGAAAASDIAKLSELQRQDILTKMGLEQADITQLSKLQLQDLATKMGLEQQDIQTLMALKTQDQQTKQGLMGKDVEGANSAQQRQEDMMKQIMTFYSSIFGGFNPAAQTGSKQTTTSGDNLGLPFANVGV